MAGEAEKLISLTAMQLVTLLVVLESHNVPLTSSMKGDIQVIINKLDGGIKI